MELYDANATKRPVNLSINSDLIEKARNMGLNLSALAEEAITAAYAKAARAKWDDEIRQACDVHSRYIAEHGTLAEAIWAMEEEDMEEEGRAAAENGGSTALA